MMQMVQVEGCLIIHYDADGTWKDALGYIMMLMVHGRMPRVVYTVSYNVH